MLRGLRIAALALCVTPSIVAAPPARDIEFLAVPDQGLQPQVRVDSAGTLHLIYFKGSPGNGDLFYVRRTANSDAWSTPLRINSQPESAIATGTIRGGQLALGKDNRVHVAWNGSNKALPKVTGKYGSPMLYARLNDVGDAFEPQRNLMQAGTSLDGGGSVATDTDGRVYVVWHAATADGQKEADRRVFVVTSTDDGATFSRETPIDANRAGVCACCGLKASCDAQGNLFVLYRVATDIKNRDMHLLASTDRGATFKDTLLTTWTVVTCPMSSATVADGPTGSLAAWETDGQVNWTHLDAKTDKLERPISPPGSPSGRKHPSLAVQQNGNVLFVWTEGTGWNKGGSLAWQVFDAKGKPTAVKGRQPGVPTWSFAAAMALPDGRFVIIH